MKTTFKGKSVTLVGKQPAIGEKIHIEGVGIDFVPYTHKANNKKTLVSIFPSINTTVCDEQTRSIVNMAKRHPNVNFISISLDLPTAIKNWCAANGFENITIISDYLDRKFAKQYGLLIDELKLMTRGIMVLDKDDKLIYMKLNSEVSQLPDFNSAEKLL